MKIDQCHILCSADACFGLLFLSKADRLQVCRLQSRPRLEAFLRFSSVVGELERVLYSLNVGLAKRPKEDLGILLVRL